MKSQLISKVVCLPAKPPTENEAAAAASKAAEHHHSVTPTEKVKG
jgi:hypothetical protein